MVRHAEASLSPFLEALNELPFVRGLALSPAPAPVHGPPRPDAVLRLKTTRRTYTLAVASRLSFLDRASTGALIVAHERLVHTRGWPLLLLARYIPRPTGERLAEAGVNFVDAAGNMHLSLASDHHVFVLGRRPLTIEPTARRPSPALVQLQFLLLAAPAAAAWPIRRVAEEAGIGKTAAASGLQRLAALGVLAPGRERGYRLVEPGRLEDDFLRGYTEILRPHLEVGRFRAPDGDAQALVVRLAEQSARDPVRWALTGAPAAYAVDRFYRGEDVPVFIDGPIRKLQQALRLLPDRAGSLTVLRPFGRRWLSLEPADVPLAHPWLVYAELLHDGEPRALEAAQHVKARLEQP
jgi:hypothetical protein